MITFVHQELAFHLNSLLFCCNFFSATEHVPANAAILSMTPQVIHENITEALWTWTKIMRSVICPTNWPSLQHQFSFPHLANTLIVEKVPFMSEYVKHSFTFSGLRPECKNFSNFNHITFISILP